MRQCRRCRAVTLLRPFALAPARPSGRPPYRRRFHVTMKGRIPRESLCHLGDITCSDCARALWSAPYRSRRATLVDELPRFVSFHQVSAGKTAASGARSSAG